MRDLLEDDDATGEGTVVGEEELEGGETEGLSLDGFDFESDFLASSLLDEDDLGERFDDFLDDPDEEEECFLCLEEDFSAGGSRGTTRETRLLPLFCSCRSSSFIA